MKKIDFSQLKVEVNIGEFIGVDVRRDLGNLLFSAANTLEADMLSRKIHGAPAASKVEFDDAECSLLLNLLPKAGVRYAVIKAIEDCGGSTD